MILHRNEEPSYFFISKFSSFSVKLVSQMKIIEREEIVGFCYEYQSIQLNFIEKAKLFNSIWHHFNTILYNQMGDHGLDILVIFKKEEHKQEFKNLIKDKEMSFDYKLILLRESEVLFVGPIN